MAIYTANCPQYVIAYFATLKLGAIVVPVNPLYVAREVEHQVKDSGAETIVVMSRFYPIVQQVRAKTPLKNVIVTNIKEYFPPVLKLLFTLAKEKKGGDHVEIAAGDHEWGAFIAAGQRTGAEGGGLAVRHGLPAVHRRHHRRVQGRRADPQEHPGQRHAVQGLVRRRSEVGKETIVTALPLFHSFGMTTCMNFGV